VLLPVAAVVNNITIVIVGVDSNKNMDLPFPIFFNQVHVSNMKNLFVLALFFILLQNCQPETKTPSKATLKKELIIQDSLIISTTGVPKLIEVNAQGELLFYDIFSHDIAILNQEGDTISYFNHFGSSDKEYEQLRGLSFLPDNQLGLYSTYDYLIFQRTGTFVRSGKVGPQGTIANPVPGLKANFYSSGDSLVFIYPGGFPPAFSVFSPGFYEAANLVSSLNLDSGNFINGVPFPGQSIFRSRYYSKNFPLVSTLGTQLFVKMPYDHEIWQYQLPDLEFQKIIQLTDEAVPQGVSFNQERSKAYKLAFKNWQQQIIYNRMFAISEDEVLLERFLPLPDHINLADNMGDYINKGLKKLRKRQLIYKSADQIQMCEIPTKLSLSAYDAQQKTIVFTGPLNETENSLTIYYGKIR
jgi:hypothetical protein